MKGTLRFDPADYDYGPASASIRRILTEWAEVDWFAPSTARDSLVRAVGLLREHNARARSVAPDLFPADIVVEPRIGTWTDFAALCARVRDPGAWDWKYGALKKLSFRHSQARGWSISEQAPAPPGEIRAPLEGDIFARLGDVVFWKLAGPTYDFRSALGRERGDLATWYTTYAYMDMHDGVEWQLAEPEATRATNPFVPLVDCYRMGYLPFGVEPARFVLFGFSRDPQRDSGDFAIPVT